MHLNHHIKRTRNAWQPVNTKMHMLVKQKLVKLNKS